MRKLINLTCICLFAITCSAYGFDYYLWLLNEGKGNVAVNYGSSGEDLKIQNPLWVEDSPFVRGKSLYFDDTGRTFIYSEDSFRISTKELTVEMWVKFKKIAGTQCLFSSKVTSTSRLTFGIREGDLFLSDSWWKRSNSISANNAIGKSDIGRWIHLAFTLSEKGYKLYKNGKCIAEKSAKPFPSQADKIAFGINVWDLKSCPFCGYISQIRISLKALASGKGSGVGELAFKGLLDKQAIYRPAIKWMPSMRPGNLFIRDEQTLLKLKVINRFYRNLAIDNIKITWSNIYYRDKAEKTLPAFVLSARAEKIINVDFKVKKAGVYRVNAQVNSNSLSTEFTYIRGNKPEDYKTTVPFFGNSSHTRITEYEYRLRREFGSRAERGSLLHWTAVQKEPRKFLWLDIDKDPLKTIVLKNGILPFGYTGYTPKFASTEPQLKNYYHAMPVLHYYRKWLEAAGRHYLGVVKYWEVWNEPNGAGAFFRGSAEQLADLHKCAAIALRRVSPELKIIGASTVSIDTEFMDRLYDAGAVDYMDIIAFHNYRWDYPPDKGIVKSIRSISAWRDKYAKGRPLWDDEWGPWTKGPREEPIKYANLLARQLIIEKAMGIQHSDVYTWNGFARYRLWFDGHWASPAAVAYRTMAQIFTNAEPVACLSEGKDNIFAYLFRKANQPTFILAAWTTDFNPKMLKQVPVVNKYAKLYDLMYNPMPLKLNNKSTQSLIDIKLTRSPIFLAGVAGRYKHNGKPLSPPLNSSPPERHKSLWLSYHYPEGTEVLGIPKGSDKETVIRVYNDGDESAKVKLVFKVPLGLKVNPAGAVVFVESMSKKDIKIKISAAKTLAEGIYRLNIIGSANGISIGRMNIRCYVADGDVRLFHIATWEMMHYLIDAKKYGQGIHIRWIYPGGYLLFKFDLQKAKSADLFGFIDSVSPAPNDGGEFKIRASTDKVNWAVLLEGRGKFAWRKVELTKYAGKKVYVRFENASDKGQSRIKKIKLVTYSKGN